MSMHTHSEKKKRVYPRACMRALRTRPHTCACTCQFLYTHAQCRHTRLCGIDTPACTVQTHGTDTCVLYTDGYRHTCLYACLYPHLYPRACTHVYTHVHTCICTCLHALLMPTCILVPVPTANAAAFVPISCRRRRRRHRPPPRPRKQNKNTHSAHTAYMQRVRSPNEPRA